MVTYYNLKDLTSFGEYLLSEKRKENIRGDRSKVHHADFENWLEERKKPAAKVEEPKAEVPQWLKDHTATTFSQKFQIPKLGPQWLIDHMATAPNELQNYVFKVFPERRTNSTANGLSGSFAWDETPEGHIFWPFVNFQSWEYAIKELSKKNLL